MQWRIVINGIDLAISKYWHSTPTVKGSMLVSMHAIDGTAKVAQKPDAHVRAAADAADVLNLVVGRVPPV